MDKQTFIEKIAGYVRKYAADYGIWYTALS